MRKARVSEASALFVKNELLPALREVLPEALGNCKVTVGVKGRFDNPELHRQSVSSSQIMVVLETLNAKRRIMFAVFIKENGRFSFTEITGSREADMYEPRYRFFPLF